MGPSFACTSCGWCCRNLVESASRAVPADWEALARQGFYPLPRVGGLQVWPWERRRLLAHSAAMRFRPALAAVAGEGTEALAVVLLWEYEGKECALVTDDQRCSVYAERPVVCRAFPLLLTGGGIAVSAKCPGAVMPERAEELPAAYGPSHAAARAARAMPGLVASYVAFLETSGRLRLRRDLTPTAAASLPTVDLLDLLEREGVATQADVEARVAGLGVAYG